jgi:alpha-methylacyl-CoA racemase
VNVMDGSAPFGAAYSTSDRQFMVVCALEPSAYRTFLERLGLGTAALPGQWERAAWPRLKEQFAAIFATRSRQEWTAIFADCDACVTPVMSIVEAPLHPQNLARNVFEGTPPLPGTAPRFSVTPTRPARTTHSAQALLEEWGVALEP